MKFLDRAAQAAKKAVATVSSRPPVDELDNELSKYERLKPEHFDKLMKAFGEENVFRYIKVMEASRSKKNV